MQNLGDKLTQALEQSKNDITSFIWKGPKKKVNGEYVQDEIKLIDATEAQLQEFYDHCKSMLYSDNKKNPGRYVLLNTVKDQQDKCNVELFIRWVEGRYLNRTERKPYPRFLYLQDLKTVLANNDISKDDYENILISSMTTASDYPDEFRDIVVKDVVNGCVDGLGIFDRSHLSLKFICELGIWLTRQELKELEEREESGKIRNRILVIKERLGLKNSVNIALNQETGLGYSEFRAMVNLKSKRYSELTTDQLTTLRNKVLFRFMSKIEEHISQWEDRIRQIKLVAKAKGFKIND